MRLPCEQSQGFQVLQDVGGLGGDQDDVELLHRLVHVANGVSLDEGVLPDSAWHQLWKGREKAFDPCLGHLDELSGEQGLAALGANRSRQQNLSTKKVVKLAAQPILKLSSG